MSTAPTPPSATYPFERRFWTPDSEIRSGDLNLATQQIEDSQRFMLYLANLSRTGQLTGSSPNRAVLSGGFYHDGFMPRANGAFGVTLESGLGFVTLGSQDLTIGGNYNLNDMGIYMPMHMPLDISFTCPGAGVVDRIDLIEARPNLYTTDAEDVRTLDETTGVVSVLSKDRTLARRILDADKGFTTYASDSTAVLSYKQGHPTSGLAPATTVGYEPVAYVYVPAGAGTITAANIYDARRVVGPLRVSVCVRKASGTNGALTLQSLDAPPGVQVAVCNDTTSGHAAYTIYILSGNANLVYDEIGTDNLPAQVSTGASGLTTATIMTNVRAGTVVISAGVVTLLSSATPTAVTAGSYMTDRRLFSIRVEHLRNDGTTIDNNIPVAVYDSITFDIPVV